MGFYLLITDENGRNEYCDEVWDGLKHAGAREFWEKIEDIGVEIVASDPTRWFYPSY